MADIVFKCNNCEQVIAVDEAGVGQTISCPKCQTAATVPKAERRLQCPQCAAELATAFHTQSPATFNCPFCRNSITLRPEDCDDTDVDEPNSADDRSDAPPLPPEILATCPKCNRDDVPFVCPNCEKSESMELKDTGKVECYCGVESGSIKCPDCGAQITNKFFRSNPANPPTAVRLTIRRSNEAVLVFCPECKTSMQPDAVLCTSCGFDLRTGKRLELNSDATTNIEESPWENDYAASDMPCDISSGTPAISENAKVFLSVIFFVAMGVFALWAHKNTQMKEARHYTNDASYIAGWNDAITLLDQLDNRVLYTRYEFISKYYLHDFLSGRLQRVLRHVTPENPALYERGYRDGWAHYFKDADDALEFHRKRGYWP